MGNNAFLEEPVIEEKTFRNLLSSEKFQDHLVHLPNFSQEQIQKLYKIDRYMKQEIEDKLFNKLLLAGKVEIAAKILEKYEDHPIA